MKASAKVAETPLGDIALLTIQEKVSIVTLGSQGQVDVFSPDENKVIETFTPDGSPTLVRVFSQFPGVLWIAYTKQAPGGGSVASLLALSGADKMEVEAHEANITDLI